jgi:hypothetical protein
MQYKIGVITLTITLGVQHILCCAFVLFVFVLCTLCCQSIFDCSSGILQRLFQFMLVKKVIVYTCLCVQYKLGVITLTLARGVQHILYCVCVLFFHRLVCPMLPISLHYPLLIAPFGIL